MNYDWDNVPLEALFAFVIGGDWGKDLDEDDPNYREAYCIRGSEIRDWRRNKGSTAALRKLTRSSIEKRKLELGDIVIEISGGGPDQPVGRTVLIDQDALSFEPNVPKVCTNFLRLVRLIDSVDRTYVNYYLSHVYVTGKVVNYQGGSNNLRNLKFQEYSKITIPLPSLKEQNAIAEKLDRLFISFDKLKTRLDTISLVLKQFRQAILTRAVKGELTQSWRSNRRLGEWRKTNIGELFSVQTGSTPKRGTPKYYRDGTIPWLKSGQVKNQVIYDAEEFITEAAIRETNAKLFPIDTLLVAMYGEGKTRGQVGWMKIEAATNQAIAALVSKEMSLTTRTYIFYYCISQYNEIRAEAEGGNQPNLNLSKIKNWEVKLPPIEEQEEIVKRIGSLFAKVDLVEKKYKLLIDRVDSVPASVLTKAFRGELLS